VPEDAARPLAGRRRAEATALPGWIKPQLTKLVDEPPEGPEWLHELKFDVTGCMPGLTEARSGC
jgi:ATP-dependent DNA ligase